MRKFKESEENTFNVDAGWDGPDWHKNGFYGIVFDDRYEGDEFIVPCFMGVDATPDKAFFGWSYWDILENSRKFIKRVEETGDTSHDVSKDGPLFIDLALWIKDPYDIGSQDKIQFEEQWLPKCRAFCSKKYDTSKIYATKYPKGTEDQLELELTATGMTYKEYDAKLEKLSDKIHHMNLPEPTSNWVYPF